MMNFNDFFKEINGFRWTLLSNLLLLLFTPYFDDYLLETDYYLASNRTIWKSEKICTK